jgi:hypothetical protein
MKKLLIKVAFAALFFLTQNLSYSQQFPVSGLALAPDTGMIIKSELYLGRYGQPMWVYSSAISGGITFIDNNVVPDFFLDFVSSDTIGKIEITGSISDNASLRFDSINNQFYWQVLAPNNIYTPQSVLIAGSQGEISEDPLDFYWDGNALFLNRPGLGKEMIDIQFTSALASNNINIGGTDGTIRFYAGNIQIGGRVSVNGDNNTVIGENSGASASGGTVVGQGSNVANQSTAMGQNAQATGNVSIASGWASEATATNTTAIGGQSISDASGASSYGRATEAHGVNSFSAGFSCEATANGDNSIVLGNRSIVYEPNTFVAGGEGGNASPITDIYFGSGIRSGSSGTGSIGTISGVDYTIHGSGAGNGTNLLGGNITIAGGIGTGNGKPGDIIFTGAVPGTSGTTFQSVQEIAKIEPETERLGMLTSDPTETVDINGTLRIREQNQDSLDNMTLTSENGTAQKMSISRGRLYIENLSDTINIEAGEAAKTILFENSEVVKNMTITNDSVFVVPDTAIYDINFTVSFGWAVGGTLAGEPATFILHVNDVYYNEGMQCSTNGDNTSNVNRVYPCTISGAVPLNEDDQIKIKISGGGASNRIRITKSSLFVNKIP